MAHNHPTSGLAGLRASGTSIWLDTLSRELIESGHFAELVREFSVTGATSNPTIFAQAICGSDRYDRQLGDLIESGVVTAHDQFLELSVSDVRQAADALLTVHRRSGGADGFVSLEVTPDLADDAKQTVDQARELWRKLDAPNVMIKVPATDAGIAAIEELTADGVNVNVTLLFAVARYEQVIDAYMRGLERRARARKPIAGLRSVASFFVSRVDAKADLQLHPDSPLRGRVGVANAHAAYDRYLAALSGERWRRLADLGATPQRPLWASTAPKDPAYRDVRYLEELALPQSILTVPEPTLHAFVDHGTAANLADAHRQAHEELVAVTDALDVPAITAELEREGVAAFCASYRRLLSCVAQRARRLARTRTARTPA